MGYICSWLYLYQLFMHEHHKRQKDQEYRRVEEEAEMIAQDTEQGRHKTASHIGACHLDSDHCLGSFCAEIYWS